MTELDRRFHETWLGMVQPIDGLVVSIPVLIDAQCMERLPPHVQSTLLTLCPPRRRTDAGDEAHTLGSLDRFLTDLLGHSPDSFDRGATLPDELSLYVPEGRQTLRPSLALRKLTPPEVSESADSTPASRAGARYEMLVWQLPTGLPLDAAENTTGDWHYPPAAKFERLLRHTRVPIGLLTNDEVIRLVYAPHGESSGAITFRLDDMASVGGRPILDAFVMLLSANRFFGVEAARALPSILAESRKRQANVTNDLADQVFEALQILLRGFEAAAERDGRDLLDEALARDNDHLYKGLLTVLLRLVFVLYAEDRGLLPVEQAVYAEHYSLLALFDRLQSDHGAWPDSMSRRFGAWGRLIALFRAVYVGVDHGELHMPPRRGDLFDPHRYPFLEGWGPAGSAPITQPEARAAVRVPTLDDETVYRVLEKLLRLDGQRLSYRALDVEQIGSVYEGLMGFHVVRLGADAVCMRPERVWLTPDEVNAVPAGQRGKWLKETLGLASAQAEKLAAEWKGADTTASQLDVLAKYSAGGRTAEARESSRARTGQLVLQPGQERRRTSSHYTPRSLSAPIVRRTLEPLLAVMGDSPASERILHLKVCDPAMGSGAFLVEACRFLADHVVAAWTREGAIESIGREHGDPLLHARRLVAQRCLYGVDKNLAAVELAKLSLWLVTLARDLPFTFVDHALRHGDSLVGLDFEQIRSFHWKPGKQLELFGGAVKEALDEAVGLRERILELASGGGLDTQREKERLLRDAADALGKVRLIADVCVGAFFAKEKDKEREAERKRRLELVTAWLKSGEPAGDELVAMGAELRARVPAFHWAVEFPEVFYSERPDPLDDDRMNRAAAMDAFVGNPPFAGKNGIIETGGDAYLPWLQAVHEGAHGNADLSAHFFRRAAGLTGSNGTIGLVATSTIAQGDTRSVGLQWLVQNGYKIYAATSTLLWGGDAKVAFSVVHLSIGTPTDVAPAPILDGNRVEAINSRLRVGTERADATPLQRNINFGFVGSFILGMGFTLTPKERDSLIRDDARNAERIFPYLGGEEVNTSPTHAFDRYVINFEQLTLEAAQQWPDLMRIVHQRVKPERDSNNTPSRRDRWWLYASGAESLYRNIAGLRRCLATARVSKHCMFHFQPVGRVFSDQLCIFSLDSFAALSSLQSRIHELWARQLSSSFGSWPWPVLRYNPTDCFETFPFPQPDPRALIPSLESIGERLYTFRAQYMVSENVGLTITYNRLKDPSVTEARIVALRALHEEMDREVLAAYGWSDIPVPPYCIATDADKKALDAFENEVIDRLFVLNAKRAEEERVRGLGGEKGGKKKSAGKKGGGKKAKGEEGQLALGGAATGDGEGEGEGDA